jgi:long-chain acyl-CoA synthetase
VTPASYDRRVATLLDLLGDAVAKYADRPALALRRDDGTTDTWTYRELDRRTRIAAWRLRALGLAPGDRVLTWSPSGPDLAATYFGAMRARLVFVPLDMRMSGDAVAGVVASSRPGRLIIGGGRDAPDPATARLADFPTTTVEALTADPDDTFPADWEAQVAAWPAPADDEVFELIFTSGTTGTPKGVMLAHNNVGAAVNSFYSIIPRLDHRIVSLLPLSHLLEQSVGLFYALSVGASVLYVRSRNPRVIFEALREHRVTSMIVVPQILDLFWSAIEREVEKAGRAAAFDRLRSIARRLPAVLRRLIFRNVHTRLGGHFRLFVSAGAFLPPALQQSWEDLGVTVLQGYGTTETGTGACTTLEDHGLGTVGRPVQGIEMRIAADGEVQFRGPSLFKGYWDDPSKTAESLTGDGWYRTGDIGHLDDGRRLVLSGRMRDMIVLPNGFNVYPEDIENALRVAGIRDSVVLETQPGRIEAILLDPRHTALGVAVGHAAGTPDDVSAALDNAVRAANKSLGANQHIAGWRLWPDEDFPRTHTLKVKRDAVRAWAGAAQPAPVREGAAASARP